MSRGRAAFAARYGPWALVAGASEGIGREFAVELAARGLDLVLVALPGPPLDELAAELSRAYRVETLVAAGDLASPELVQRLFDMTAALEVGLVVCNAAAAPIGPFLGLEPTEKLRVLDVNCRAPLLLADHYGRRMASRGRGGIVFMSSLAGLQGTPLVAMYSATKAFVLALAEALWDELRRQGVDVCCLCAGPTRTPTYEASRPRGPDWPEPMDPARVASLALEELERRRRPASVAGWPNAAIGLLVGRLLPRRHAVALMGRAMRARYGR
jgi:hypothetical protein